MVSYNASFATSLFSALRALRTARQRIAFAEEFATVMEEKSWLHEQREALDVMLRQLDILADPYKTKKENYINEV